MVRYSVLYLYILRLEYINIIMLNEPALLCKIIKTGTVYSAVYLNALLITLGLSILE